MRTNSIARTIFYLWLSNSSEPIEHNRQTKFTNIPHIIIRTGKFVPIATGL